MVPIIYQDFTAFFRRRLYSKIVDCFNRPIASAPGAWIEVVSRTSPDGNITFENNFDETSRCLNLGSYNYLGFADEWDKMCGNPVREGLSEFGVSTCSSAVNAGTTLLHQELEKVVAEFVGKPAAVVYSMGYGTNTAAIAALMGKGSLILSDKLNHTSIVNGCRESGAKVKAFHHNDVQDLERLLKEMVVLGRGAKGEGYVPWTKILVMVEGIYSMEGEICKLREIVDVVKKYKAYIYVDEAHSIGALGKTGRGVCEHTGVDPSEVDILMGTFSKSFGGMGGYVAASKEIVDYLKSSSNGCVYSSTLSPTVTKQILTAFKIIKGEDNTTYGKEKLEKIKENANFFRNELRRIGLDVLGDEDSPVVPMMIYHGVKIGVFSRECYKRGLATVVVGAPAVPLYGGRARFCISAAHSKEDLRDAVKKIKEVAKIINLRYNKSIFG